MQAYRVKTIVSSDGSLTIKHLPLSAGDTVEVIVLVQKQSDASKKGYLFHDTPIVYNAPFDPVAVDDWGLQP
jgi:hypothetical protein